MFERIHFNIVRSKKPLTNVETLQHEMEQDQNYSSDLSMLSSLHFFDKCLFCIEGKSYTMPIRPITTFAKEKLFFVQSFSMLEASPRFFTKRNNTDSYMLIYTYSGNGYLEYEGKNYNLERGDGFFIDCQKEHMYRTEGTQWKHSVLHFSGSVTEYLFQEFSSMGNVKFSQPVTGAYQTQLERVLEIYESIDPYREILLSNALENLLMSLLVQTKQYMDKTSNLPENLRYLVQYIDNNYAKPLSLDYMAEFSNMSKFHLCKLFKKYLSFTPNEYIIWQRIENAKILLKTTKIPANQIGVMVGITDENYFYRLFKKRVGLPPEAFRTQV
ncbi:AraC family transcriptional regulator [Clostridium sp. AF19-22AC]|uniref:helix-turn-helix transcriptional regulator n=1 Tax=Clostridia TaxID=186801 RepID=UPI000E5327DB|nr:MULTISPECIES: AraC family transcriptional regulator [Clostridia]RHR22561.1 AraC family transcriptional regulator [Clostridium sp. AF19-22AC]